MGTTLGEVLDRAAAQLARAGVATPRREAGQLCAAVLDTSPGELWLERASPLDESTRARLATALRNRAGGMPAAYAAGRHVFRSLDLATDPRALIPRPETEGLVELVLAWASRRWGGGPWGVAADVGTGTGCIAIALATEGRFRRVIAIERSQSALSLARENVELAGAEGTVEIRHGDGLSPLGGQRVDVLVSNPPYLTEDEYATLESSVRDYEPREALVSGETGLVMTERLLVEARGVVGEGGLLAMEVDARRAAVVADRARGLGWREVRVAHDLWGRPRYVVASLSWR